MLVISNIMLNYFALIFLVTIYYLCTKLINFIFYSINNIMYHITKDSKILYDLLSNQEKQFYDRLKQQVLKRREQEIMNGANYFHCCIKNIPQKVDDKYKKLLSLVHNDIRTSEQRAAKKLGLSQREFCRRIREKMLKPISIVLGEQGPEIYMVIVRTLGFDKFLKKQCALVSKGCFYLIKMSVLRVNYGDVIYCSNVCGKRMYIDADMVYYYDKNKVNYQEKILNGLPTCPVCIGDYVRTTIDDTVKDYLAWNTCYFCKVLFIDGVYDGKRLLCPKCRWCQYGNRYYNTHNNKVHITNNNFMY